MSAAENESPPAADSAPPPAPPPDASPAPPPAWPQRPARAALIVFTILSIFVAPFLPFTDLPPTDWPLAFAYCLLLAFVVVGVRRNGRRVWWILILPCWLFLLLACVGVFFLRRSGLNISAPAWVCLKAALWLAYAVAGWWLFWVVRGWWLYLADSRRAAPPAERP